MPELPDVQVLKEYVDATALHQPILDIHSEADELRETLPHATLESRLAGQEILSTRRYGKHLLLEVTGTGGWLRLHFGMSGGLRYYRGDTPPEHTRLLLDFADGYHLAYTNQRKFGQIGWTEDVDAFVEAEGLGPDAMSLDPESFKERLAGRRGSIKGTLMDQGVVAGLGNVYVDEILFQAGIHPESTTDELDESDLEHLFDTMHEVVDAAVAARAEREEMPESFLVHAREAGADCPRCGRPVEKIEVVGRPTYVCPHEQPPPASRPSRRGCSGPASFPASS